MENKYEIILYWSKDDNAVIAEVPELAGLYGRWWQLRRCFEKCSGGY